jgi:type IV pilus assembly protein PilB
MAPLVSHLKEEGLIEAEARGEGCEVCNQTGYKGRVGLYEELEVTDAMRELILVGASAIDLRRKGGEEGMVTLRESGLLKIRQGVTTVEEVTRETVK